MMKTFAIDFETYYDNHVSIKKLGPQGYFNHPEFEAYMVTIVGDDGTEFAGHPKDAPWSLLKGHRALSHNASFDEALYYVGVKQGWWPEVKVAEWHCTADLAAYSGYPRSLKGAAAEVLGIELSKDTRDNMKGKRPKDMGADFYEEVREYALDDSRYCLQLWEKLSPNWPETERAISALNRRIVANGLPIDEEALRKNVEHLYQLRFDAEQSIPWVGRGSGLTPLSRKAFNEECRTMGIEPPKSLAQDSPEAAKWLATYQERCPWAVAVSDFRRINSLLSKLEKFQGGTMPDGRYYGALLYFGAHTGRFSGSGGNANLQNLPRGELFGVDFRRMIKTPPGRSLVVVDLSQIEVRTLCWLAGDTKALKLIAESDDIYHAFGVLLGLHDEANGPLSKYDPTLRHKIKSIVLGCGYGMGVARFAQFAGIDENEAHDAVMLYRRRMRKVKKLWESYDEDLVMSQSLQQPFKVELPSGRTIDYGVVKRMKDPKGGYSHFVRQVKNGQFRQVKTWGGTVTENCISHSAEVLSHWRGWVPLASVTTDDLIWDGVDFVRHDGFVDKGVQDVISVHGVRSTPDHKFLVDGKWVDAEEACVSPARGVLLPHEIKRPIGANLRYVYRNSHSREARPESPVGAQMQVWEDDSQELGGSTAGENLRKGVPIFGRSDKGQQFNSWQERAQAVRCVEVDDRQVSPAISPSLEKLRSTRDNSMPEVEGVVPEFLGRHASDVGGGPDIGPDRQQQRVLPRELPLGDPQPAGQEHEEIKNNSGAIRDSSAERGEALHTALPPQPRVADGESNHHSPEPEEQVGDILNCGPRNRFVVRGGPGMPALIAHNCSQGLARDIFCHHMLEIDRAGHDIILHVHDEVVVETDTDKAEEVLREIEGIMSTPPPWIEIPLAAEGKVLEFYQK